MNYWPLVTIGVSILGSVIGSYLAVRVELARMDERMKSAEKRLERHSDEFDRINQSFFSRQSRSGQK
jgi:hypothetical protein